MKTAFMTLASLLVTASAFAMPAVGDQALYNFSVTQGGQTISGTMEQVITGMDGAKFVVQVTTNTGKDSQVDVQKMDAQDLLSDSTVTSILQNCAGYGGKPEIVNVPAGSFATCGLPASGENTGTIWVGDVAFGIVKADMTNSQSGAHTLADLQSSKKGQ